MHMKSFSFAGGLPVESHCQGHAGLHRQSLVSLALVSLGTDSTQVTDGDRVQCKEETAMNAQIGVLVR